MAACFTAPTKLERHPTTSTAPIRKAFLLRYLEPVRLMCYISSIKNLPVIVFIYFCVAFYLHQSTSPPLSQMETCWVMICTAAP